MRVVIGLAVREMPLPKYRREDLKLGYLAGPRSASNTTKEALIHQAGFSRNAYAHHTYLSERPPGWRLMTTVRNHFDTLMSWWTLNFENGKYWGDRPDERWLMDLLFHKTTRIYYPDPHRLWALHLPVTTDILRFETLEPDLNRVLAEHGLGPVKLTPHNVNQRRQGRTYQELIGPQLRAFIEDWFGEEMEELGYAW